jgi:hypothetical protein
LRDSIRNSFLESASHRNPDANTPQMRSLMILQIVFFQAGDLHE